MPSRQGTGRSVCFDLENRPAAYWYDGQTTSEITAFGWKWSDENRVWTMLLLPGGMFAVGNGKGVTENLADEHAYRLFVSELARADLVYGHNIVRHDLPILNAALLRRERDPLPALRISDTCTHLPKRNGLSYSLENLAAMYGLPGKKYSMSQPDWEEANRLTDAGIELARKRVASDVILQERLRKKLLALGILKPPRRWSP